VPRRADPVAGELGARLGLGCDSQWKLSGGFPWKGHKQSY
jgi:hypothetical protein